MSTTSGADKPRWSKRLLEDHVEAMVRYFDGLPVPTERKTERELAILKAKSEGVVSETEAGCACWFKDSNGGDICFPYPSAQACTDDKGTPAFGDCPNFFAAMKSAKAISQLFPKEKKPAKSRKKSKRVSS